MYDSEKTFGVALMNKCRKQGFDVMRVESASTISGCPDVWLQYAGDDWWLELKNVLHDVKKDRLKVKWRPGQVGWSVRYKNNHQYWKDYNGIPFLISKCSWTVIALKSIYVFYRMRLVEDDNMIDLNGPDAFVFDLRGYSALSMRALLSQHSYVVTPAFPEAEKTSWSMLLDAWKYAWLDVCRHLGKWKGLDDLRVMNGLVMTSNAMVDYHVLLENAVRFSDRVLSCMPGYKEVRLAKNL